MTSQTFSSGVLFGDEAWALLNYAKEKQAALPAVNVISTSTINAVLETARDLNSPVIIQLSNGGSVFYAGKGLGNDDQNAAIQGAVSVTAHFKKGI